MLTEADVKRMKKAMKADNFGIFLGKGIKNFFLYTVKIPLFILMFAGLAMLFFILGIAKGIIET